MEASVDVGAYRRVCRVDHSARTMSHPKKLRIVTYNIHKCRGMDARVRPERVAAVLAELDVDVIALQEVIRGKRERDQLAVIAKEVGAKHYRFGMTRKY